jgi:hypothetical protein
MTDRTQTTSSEGGDGAAEQAQDKAKEVASQAQDKAREAAGQARGQLRGQVDQRSTQLGEQVSSSASDARSVAEELRKQGKDAPARYVEQAADRAERLGGYLRDSDSDRILGDVEDFARRNTWAVALGGLALGFAAARMLKASSANRYQSYSLERSRAGYLEHAPSQGGAAPGGRFTRESPASGSDLPSAIPGGEPATPEPTTPPVTGTTGGLATGGRRPGSGE